MTRSGPSATAVSAPTSDGRRLGRVRTLDGLRAIAIAAVFCVHLSGGVFPGGIFGVDLFFVLSGFLITFGLLGSAGRGQGIPFRHFYIRRARRLLPALFLLLGVYVVYMVIFVHGKDFTAGGETVVGSLFYLNNWFPVFGYSPPWGLDHLWSLSVEEQFYLVWPLLLWLMIRSGVTRRTCMIITASAAVASMLLRAIVFAGNHDPLTSYYMTFTHADGILLGCFIAQVYVWRVNLGGLATFLRSPAVGYVAIAGLIACFTQFGTDDANTYYFGMAIAVILAAVALCNQLARLDSNEKPSLLDRALGSAPMVAIGRRSYSLYLWQNLVMFFLSGPLRGSAWWWPANVAVSFACAEISYRFVELRFLRTPLAVEVRPETTKPQSGRHAAPKVAAQPESTLQSTVESTADVHALAASESNEPSA
jgi:peptidoglycan/LPS O-acetylase OafA/YrhL